MKEFLIIIFFILSVGCGKKNVQRINIKKNNIDNKIELLDVSIKEQFLYLFNSYKIEILGGSPPYKIKIIQGDGAILNKNLTPRSSGKIVIEVLDTKGQRTVIEKKVVEYIPASSNDKTETNDKIENHIPENIPDGEISVNEYRPDEDIKEIEPEAEEKTSCSFKINWGDNLTHNVQIGKANKGGIYYAFVIGCAVIEKKQSCNMNKVEVIFQNETNMGICDFSVNNPDKNLFYGDENVTPRGMSLQEVNDKGELLIANCKINDICFEKYDTKVTRTGTRSFVFERLKDKPFNSFSFELCRHKLYSQDEYCGQFNPDYVDFFIKSIQLP